MFYDPMIAKLCTYGESREQAIEVMRSSLSSYIIRGISHNISFLEALISNPRFIVGDINTAFIEEEYPHGFSGATLTSDITKIFLATTIFIYITEQKRASLIAGQTIDQVNKIGINVTTYVRSTRLSELEALMVNKFTCEEQGELQAPLAGQIIAIKVQEGSEIIIGQEIMVLTAMKMENIIIAARSGKIAKIL
ncbi:unnamed protein product, partial [Didymodactylos carnosus]